jgi:hypothetical protein
MDIKILMKFVHYNEFDFSYYVIYLKFQYDKENN